MRKSMVVAVCLGILVLGMSGIAGAVSYSYTETLNATIGGWPYSDSASWSYSTPSGFTVPYDHVNIATLTVNAKNVSGGNDLVFVENLLQVSPLNNSGSTATSTNYGIASLFTTWAVGDLLNVTVKANEGIFNTLTLVNSVFYLDYTDGYAQSNPPPDNNPVPEPATLLLLGAGLLGLGLYGRKRMNA